MKSKQPFAKQRLLKNKEYFMSFTDVPFRERLVR